MAVIINGTVLAKQLNDAAARETAAYCASDHKHIPPCLAVICVGDNPASKTYIAVKQAALKNAGMRCTLCRFPETAAAESVRETIDTLNASPDIHGILIQLPLPKHLDPLPLITAIHPLKDVDGFTPVNLGKLLSGSTGFIPCTAQAVMHTITAAHIPAAGAHAVIIGRSLVAGKPLAALLTHADATVTLCHSKTVNLVQYTRYADIVITAAGCPALLTGDMIKKGAAVIDVGINRIADSTAVCGYRITGDADFESVERQAGWITPVPGGIGPLTVAMLLKNTLKAACLQCAVC